MKVEGDGEMRGELMGSPRLQRDKPARSAIVDVPKWRPIEQEDAFGEDDVRFKAPIPSWESKADSEAGPSRQSNPTGESRGSSTPGSLMLPIAVRQIAGASVGGSLAD